MGIPILKDIPLLGFLFRHKVIAPQNIEVIVLITPTVVESVSEASERGLAGAVGASGAAGREFCR